tara:strand:- start:4306 stop:4509 length:204 start_codon:yes stop_codon:yes gene_type:complete
MEIKTNQTQADLLIDPFKSGRKPNQTAEIVSQKPSDFIETSLDDIVQTSVEVGKAILANATTKIISK